MGHDYTICVNGRSGGYLVLHECSLEKTGHLSFCSHCGQRNFKKVAPVFPQGSAEAVIAAEMLKTECRLLPGKYLEIPSIQFLSLADDEKLSIIWRLRAVLSDCSAGDKCGVCGHTRTNYTTLPSRLSVSNQGIDQGEDFDSEEWSMSDLRNRVDLVTAFDAACDAIRENFIAVIENCEVVDETVYQPVHVRRLELAA
jgi:hypothetical protein